MAHPATPYELTLVASAYAWLSRWLLVYLIAALVLWQVTPTGSPLYYPLLSVAIIASLSIVGLVFAAHARIGSSTSLAALAALGAAVPFLNVLVAGLTIFTCLLVLQEHDWRPGVLRTTPPKGHSGWMAEPPIDRSIDPEPLAAAYRSLSRRFLTTLLLSLLSLAPNAGALVILLAWLAFAFMLGSVYRARRALGSSATVSAMVSLLAVPLSIIVVVVILSQLGRLLRRAGWRQSILFVVPPKAPSHGTAPDSHAPAATMPSVTDSTKPSLKVKRATRRRTKTARARS